MNIPWKIYQGRQSSCPLGVSIMDIARVFNWIKCLDGFLYLKPTAGCQISTLIFEKKIMEGGPYKYPIKIYQGRQSFAHLGFQSKVLGGPLNDWSAWVGFCTSSPQQGVKYQLWYLKTNCGGGSLWISHEKYIKEGKVLAHFGLMLKVLSRSWTDISAYVR